MSIIALMRLALHQFWRELRNTDLKLFLISLFLVMISVTTIELFTNRVQLALVRQGSTFIAADQMIRQPVPIPEQWHSKAKEMGLDSSGYILFTSMLVKGEEMVLAGVKGVKSGYPLRGKLTISDTFDSAERNADDIPEPGTVWLESALANRLAVLPGDTITLGATQLRFTNYIRYEPDRNVTFFAFIPRAMVHNSDLQKAKVLMKGSRVTNVFLYAGDNDVVKAMFEWLETQKHENARIIDPRDDGRGIGQTLNRAEDFLVLSGLLITLLCGIGIALAAQRYTLLRYSHIAIYKSLGMTSKQIMVLIGVQLVGILLLSWLVSSFAGWGVQQLLAELAYSIFKVRLPEAFSPLTFLHSLFTGLVAVTAFALPDFIRLCKVPAMHIIRAGNLDLHKRLGFLPGVIGMMILTLLYSNSLLLSVSIFIGMILCWLLASMITKVVIASASKGDNFWSLLCARMRKRKMQYGLQTVVFSLCIVFGLMLLLVRTSLLENWKNQTPEDAVNTMLVNIGPDQKQPVNQALKTVGINTDTYYPIIRGRFIKLNDTTSEDIAEQTQTDQHAHRRELSLTFMSDLPKDNELLTGAWWPEAKQPPDNIARISVEQFMADNYNIKTGDIMTFRIGATELSAQVANIRDVEWSAFRPNFYVIFEPGFLEQHPYTYMTGVHISQQKSDALNMIVRQFGNISVFSAEVILQQIRKMVEQVSNAIEVILAMLIIAGIVVVITGVRSTLDERLHECALMRTFGASYRTIVMMVVVEFSILGLISGVLGAVGAETISWYLHKQIFELQYMWNPYVWIVGPLTGVLLIGISGTLGCLPSVRQPPIVILRSMLN